jgi:acetyl esterase/lipase
VHPFLILTYEHPATERVAFVSTGRISLSGNVFSTALLLTLVLLFSSASPAQRGDRHRFSHEHSSSPNCFDPSDPDQVRLWNQQAPGAQGDDPCRDVPFMRIFQSDRERRIPAPVILIIPGGGYDRLTDTDEQSPVAEYFSRTLHVMAVVLYYRLAQKDGSYRYPVPMWDGQRAVKLLRFEAPKLGIDPERIALFGFSAGGHLASTLALHPATDFGLTRRDEVDRESGRPTLLGLGYPVISMDPADVSPSGSYRNLLRGYKGAELRKLQNYLSGEKNVTARLAPVFLFESLDDAVISPANSELFVDALKRQGVSTDAHLFPHGKHGVGLATEEPEEHVWPELFGRWLDTQHFLDRPLALTNDR